MTAPVDEALQIEIDELQRKIDRRQIPKRHRREALRRLLELKAKLYERKGGAP